MKKFFKTFFILCSIFVLGFIVVAVVINNAKVDALESKNETTSETNNIEVTIRQNNEIFISQGITASIQYNLEFEGINNDGSFNNAEMEVTYQQANDKGSSSHTDKYSTNR